MTAEECHAPHRRRSLACHFLGWQQTRVEEGGHRGREMKKGKEAGEWVGELSRWRLLHAGWRQTPAECGRYKDDAKYSTDKDIVVLTS